MHRWLQLGLRSTEGVECATALEQWCPGREGPLLKSSGTRVVPAVLRRLLLWSSSLCLMVGGVSVTRAQQMRDLVEQVLDQKIEGIQIADVPLPEALQQLGEKTGLRFELSERAIGWMPYGAQTRVSIDLADVRVRDGLRRMFAGLGLSMQVEGDAVAIAASPALERLGRRMTIDEIKLLTNLAGAKWSELAAESRHLQVVGSELGQSVEAAIGKAPGDTAAEQLENAGRAGRWCWVPEAGSVLVYSRTEDVRRRLNRRIDLDYQGVPLDEILLDLGRHVGVTMLFEPGVLKRIQATSRSVDLIYRGTTVRQTLELIGGRTGLAYKLSDDGVRVGSTTPQAAASRHVPGRIVALLRVPIGDDGTTIEFPFYEDDVPPEFERLRQSKLPEVIEELRRREGE